MADVLITEYSENVKNAQVQLGLAKDKTQESFEDPEAFIITFSEDPDVDQVVTEEFPSESHDDTDVTFHESEDMELPSVDDDEMMDAGDLSSMSFQLPGAVDYVEDDLEDEEEEEEVDDGSNTNWENDRDVRHFMAYIIQKANNIPKHDGYSTLGCERAILYLTNLNKEISEALRADPKAYSGKEDAGSPLDLEALERIRIKIISDITKLKERIKTLNKKHKKVKKADESIEMKKDGESPSEITKEATTPRIQLVMTPFERAITGMIINATVSSGKPLEDVYELLKKKYAFSNREELSIIQLLMDMGQPIFKDRGMIGETGDSGESVDFMKNYFA